MSLSNKKLPIGPVIVATIVAVIGVGSTLHWLGYTAFITGNSLASGALPFPQVAGAIAFVSALTLLNLLLRWMRWHFLIRRFGLLLKTRRSIQLYFGTLGLMITPFFIGELLRPLLISRHEPEGRRVIFWIWFVERFSDAMTLLLLWFAATQPLVATGILALYVVAALWLLNATSPSDLRNFGTPPRRSILLLVLLSLSAISWSLPALGLYGALHLMGSDGSLLQSMHAFSKGSLLGGVSGIPLGIGATGSVIATTLSAWEPNPHTVGWSVFALRLGTVWFALFLGVSAFLLWRRLLQTNASGEAVAEHFNELAPDYDGEIPEHIRDRLLARKVEAMTAALPSAPLRGLDVGCGQGWYAIALAKRGIAIDGVDISAGQIEQAQKNAVGLDLNCQFQATTAASLPFADARFDFAYAINVVHHVLSPTERAAMFDEIVRVLKPGGLFFLHEINTRNPLFRFYMSYVFPLIRNIDEGNERWLHPLCLPTVAGAEWLPRTDYFTFLPDFVPLAIMKLLRPLERRLEQSPARFLSAHFMSVLRKIDE